VAIGAGGERGSPAEPLGTVTTGFFCCGIALLAGRPWDPLPWGVTRSHWCPSSSPPHRQNPSKRFAASSLYLTRVIDVAMAEMASLLAMAIIQAFAGFGAGRQPNFVSPSYAPCRYLGACGVLTFDKIFICINFRFARGSGRALALTSSTPQFPGRPGPVRIPPSRQCRPCRAPCVKRHRPASGGKAGRRGRTRGGASVGPR